jgi:hypothetical protein
MTTTRSVPSSTPRQAGRTPRRWPIRLYRLTVTAAAVLAFNQAVFAGQFLSGTYPALRMHRDMSNVTFGVVAVGVVAAILLRRFGSGPRWPVPACVALLALTALQALFGYWLVLTVHIPLGVAVIVLLVALTAAAWKPAR